MLAELTEKIHARRAEIGVIGLGYVGLPVACMFARVGFHVTGVDIQSGLVEKVNRAINPIEGDEPGLDELLAEVVRSGKLSATSQYAVLSGADILLIAVETPVDDQHVPQYSALINVCQDLGPVLKRGALVIVESTLSPGTMDNLVRPELENSSSLVCDRDFFLGVCPERVMPGRLLENLVSMSRVCGGSTPQTARVMVELYRTYVEADLDATDPLTAELVKTAENAYRDVQIAFANEVALICEAAGGDVWRVRELVNKSPNRSMHLPGAGVGGHCIPKDPWLLAHNFAQGVHAGGIDHRLRLIPAARAINDHMPHHMFELLGDGLAEAGRDVQNSRILVLGFAYLEDSDDTRNSPSQSLVQLMEVAGADVLIHDPYISTYHGDLYKLSRGCDAIVLMVSHRQYYNLDLKKLKDTLRTPLVVDGRNLVSPEDAQRLGYIYRSIGRAPNAQGGYP